jgi:hypothetical protein
MMRTLSGLLAAGMAACCFALAPAAAQDAGAGGFPVPDLAGVWTGAYKTLRWNGAAEGTLQFRVIEQDGPSLKVEKSWQLAPGGAQGDVGGQLLSEATEPMVGVIGFDGRAIYLAEEGDSGVYTGRLTGPDSMELVYFEPGKQATAYRVQLRRSE